MWIITVLLILCLGHISLSASPYGVIALKRNSGWRSYALLAIYGLKVLLASILGFILLFIGLTVIAALINLILLAFNYEAGAYTYLLDILKLKIYREIYLFEIIIIIIAFSISKKNLSNHDLDNLFFENQDTILKIVSDAIIEQQLVRITLKSRKIYIGRLIEDDPLSIIDMDNLSIVPFLSGYRKEDDLQMTIKNNYYKVYEAANLIDDQKITNLSKFTIVVKMSEVESIGFFDLEYMEKFEPIT